LEPNPRDQKQAGIREEFECLARTWKMLYINALDWLCWQSAANGSPYGKFPVQRENTGNFVDFRPGNARVTETHQGVGCEIP